MRLHIKVIDGIKRQNSKHLTYFFNCLILLLFTCQFKQIHTGNGLVPARHHCRNALRLDPVSMFYSLFVELISFHTINTRTVGGGMKASLWLEYDNNQKPCQVLRKKYKSKIYCMLLLDNAGYNIGLLLYRNQ